MKEAFVNLAHYPLDRPDSDAYRSLVQGLAQDLTRNGFVCAPDFLTPEGIEVFNREIDERMPRAYYSEHGPNAYYDRFPYELPYEILNSKSYCIGRDRLLGTQMDALYHWPALRQFVGAITGHEQVYLHEDPANALIVQLYKAGCEIGWHFDRTLFTSIINLGEPLEGGIFECVPDLRSDEDPCYDEVHAVLQGRSTRVQRHRVAAGSLTLMLGRHSYHRVTRVEQEKPRISLVLNYELEPGVKLDDAARERIFGPAAPREAG